MKLSRKVILAATLAITVLSGDAVSQRTRSRRTPRPSPSKKPVAPAAKTAAPAAGVVNLSAADIALIISGLEAPSEARAKLASSAEARKQFAKELRQMYAVAEEGRAAGVLAAADLKFQMGLARSIAIARAYTRKREAQGATRDQIVSDAETSVLLVDPGQPARFEEFLQDLQRNRPEAQRGVPISKEDEALLQKEWASVMVAERKGVAAGVDKERVTALMINHRHAQLIASRYFENTLAARTKATEAEIRTFLAEHHELDMSKLRAQAEEILRRAKAGEDFGKLANEFTTDPSGKGTGGELGWFGRGVMVKPFEDAAFALKPGEIGGVVETQFGFHIIKVEERRATKEGSEEVHARHILIGTPTQGKSVHEIAREVIERTKRERLIEEITARSHVSVAEDFVVQP